MISLTFSVANFSHAPTKPKLSNTLLPTTNHGAAKPSSNLKFKIHQEPLECRCQEKAWQAGLLTRREAIPVGIFISLVHVILQPKMALAAAPCELTVAPSGLAYCDEVVGTGPEAVKGQLIKAHYVGKLENGKVFDSSYNRGKPLTFRVGVGEVIKGWDEGIVGGDGVPPMQAGGKRILKLPPELGYGIRGAGCKGGSCVIPPDSVLLFNVEFIGKA